MKISIARLFIGIVLSCFVTIQAQAEPRSHIRFYKANKLLQEDRIFFTGKKSKTVGCHNFLKSARIYRINQVGFKQCQLFAKKNCKPDSLMEVVDEDNSKTTMMTQGTSWYPSGKDERGKKAKSWQCEK